MDRVMEQDHQEAMKLCRKLNGSKRRKLVLPTRTMETRSSKKAYVDSLKTISTNGASNLSMLLKDSPISLVSPSISDSSPKAVLPSPLGMRGQSPTNFITSPLLGNNSSYEFTLPLSISSFVAAPIQAGPLDLAINYSIISNHVGQNVNGTWFVCSSTTPMNQGSNQAQATGNSRSVVKSTSGNEYFAEISDHRITGSDKLLKNRRGKKRKVDYGELSFQENQSSPEPMEHLEERAEKKPARKRNPSIKITNTGKKSHKVLAYYESFQEGKPDPIGQPEVWASKRQQLCEALPYYNAYQSGAYTHDGIARSILIDKEVSVRDKFDEEVVITSVGGGRLPDEETGRMVYKTDQVFSSIANAFMRAMELTSPVAVIAGQGNKISPTKLPHYYNVLDWFHVTDVWQEKVLGHNEVRVSIWKVRLEKIELVKRSWWAAQTAPVRDNEINSVTDKYTCTTCGHESKVRFNIGSACLNASCSEFFNFGIEYDDNSLDYNLKFLNERTKYRGNQPDPLSPPPPTNESLDKENDYGYERLYKQGIVCQKCGCCTRRIEWKQWSCENDKCDYIHRVKQHLVPLSKVVADGMDSSREMYIDNDVRDERLKAPHKGIRFSQSVAGSYDLYNYDVPNESGGLSGSIRHFKSNRLINQQKDGPNDLFHEIQTSELDLKRGVAVHKGTTQETLTNHFTQNFGAAYKYLVAQDSKAFGEAPPVIIKATKRMVWAGQHTLMKSHEPYYPFNECLVLGYFDGSKIGFHDDGEKTLGPTVATLSLGANATMNFRPKRKTHIPSLDDGNTRARGRGRDVGDSAGNREKKDRPTILSIKLEHGDIVIMHGREIQKLFEHEVIPNGGLRFALTCRHIDPQTLLNEDERRTAAEKGTFPPGSEQFDYDGSILATAEFPQQNRGIHISNNIKAKLEVGELHLSDVEYILQNLAKYTSTQTSLHNA